MKARRIAPGYAVAMTTPDPSNANNSVTVQTERGVLVMRFTSGRMDGHAVRQMYELTVQHISTPNARLLIDLTGVEHIASAGLGMFVTLRKKCLGVGSQMHIAVPDSQVRKLFTVMNLQIVLPLFETCEQAFARFKPPAPAE